MQPLIIGLDPGTTTAYAILDSNRDIIKVASRRNIKLSTIIRDIIRYGKPLLVGTDKEKIPRLVKKFSLATGAKIVGPFEDRTVKEKRLSATIKTKNEHETDALACAFYAYDKYGNTFRKIKNNLIKNNKIELLDYVMAMVLLEDINIYKAVKILESKQ